MDKPTVMYNGEPISAEDLRETGFLYVNLANAMDRADKQEAQYLLDLSDEKEMAEAIAAQRRVQECADELQANYHKHNARIDAENARRAAAAKKHLRNSNLLYAAAGFVIAVGAALALLPVLCGG